MVLGPYDERVAQGLPPCKGCPAVQRTHNGGAQHCTVPLYSAILHCTHVKTTLIRIFNKQNPEILPQKSGIF